MLQPEDLPTKVLPEPEVTLQPASQPTATPLAADVTARKALLPKAAFVRAVQPNTIPATIGVADGTDGIAAHFNPDAQAESADKTKSFVPTGSAVAVEAPVAVTRVPFAVRQAKGI
jgi:hypothetical protein